MTIVGWAFFLSGTIMCQIAIFLDRTRHERKSMPFALLGLTSVFIGLVILSVVQGLQLRDME